MGLLLGLLSGPDEAQCQHRLLHAIGPTSFKYSRKPCYPITIALNDHQNQAIKALTQDPLLVDIPFSVIWTGEDELDVKILTKICTVSQYFNKDDAELDDDDDDDEFESADGLKAHITAQMKKSWMNGPRRDTPFDVKFYSLDEPTNVMDSAETVGEILDEIVRPMIRDYKAYVERVSRGEDTY